MSNLPNTSLTIGFLFDNSNIYKNIIYQKYEYNSFFDLKLKYYYIYDQYYLNN